MAVRAGEAIAVLAIETAKDAGGPGSQTPLADLLARLGRPGASRLNLWHVAGLERAEGRLRNGGIDAVVLEEGDVGAIARLHACAPDLPILVVGGEASLDATRQAVDAGAQDMLLQDDLTSHGLERRIDLAIARKSAERGRLRHARRDELTGLANTELLEERFGRALARADRFATLVGLVAIDLDDFETVIARHGRPLAESLLTMAAERLQGETRKTDTLARTRDHGFTWLVEGLAAVDDINALVNRMPRQLAEPLPIGDRSIRLTASVGVAICPLHGRDFHTAHAMAEAAMLDVATISGDGLLMLPLPTRWAALT